MIFIASSPDVAVVTSLNPMSLRYSSSSEIMISSSSTTMILMVDFPSFAVIDVVRYNCRANGESLRRLRVNFVLPLASHDETFKANDAAQREKVLRNEGDLAGAAGLEPATYGFGD